ncbi:ATP-binding response regulator [Roseofilum capinflatum]|uniref:histidine kinase n=1 Tax=Roseofilum capinflatum BLCC-M114 TaxID=3022440 RepID=A0ABT7B5E5_9CYAN|nr:ATP-binding protein [Roseofilum capinflatum]MDJ1174387.1 ATP-binding protein [Roseofilum capinflatum BLCC-M114]
MDHPNSSDLTVSEAPLTHPTSNPQLVSPKSLHPPSARVGFIQWFKNLPIRQKQLIGLFTSEIISIVGLVGVGAYLIIKSGRNQLENQAKSELAVSQINYNIKIDQMGFGFRGQSDNLAIIQAAKYHRQDQPIPPELEAQVHQILENELRARNIEYATLVGNNLEIIVNGNHNRTGGLFNPNNLVKIALNTGEQIKTSEIISWQDLESESPEHLAALTPGKPGLIRYTITPVKDPQTNKPIAVLVSGDLVNKKLKIVQSTLEALDGGYSGIYLYDPPTQEFHLITSIKKIDDRSQSSAYAAVYNEYVLDYQLPDFSLLQKAINTPNQNPVTQRIQLGEQQYTVAAKAIHNYQGQPIGILVRGTSETSLAELTQESLLFQAIVAAFALGIDIILAILLGITITRPIKRLQQVTQSFSQGNLRARSPVISTDEIGHLTANFNQMADRILNAFQEIQHHTQSQAELNLELLAEIEQRKAVEEALRNSQEQLEEAKQAAESANQAKSEFLANMSHELRTPLNGILGYAQILERNTQLTCEYGKAISVIHQCGSHLLTLINDVLDLSKIEARKLELVTHNIDFPNFLQTIVHLLQVRAHSQNLTLTYQWVNEIPQVIYADEKRLRQVLINLLGNAIKFTDAGEVTFTVEVLDCADFATLKFVIADTGIGMTEEQIKKIFSPFEQVGDREKNSQGTGLGLAISQQIIRLMGSEITVTSTLGEGSRFEFILDLEYQNDRGLEAPVALGTKVRGYEGKGKKVLILSRCGFKAFNWDRRLYDSGGLIQDLLTSLGFEVMMGELGEIGQFWDRKPDLIIVDGLGGDSLRNPFGEHPQHSPQILDRLRSHPQFQDTPILTTVDPCLINPEASTLNQEKNGVICKPIQLEELLCQLERLLNLTWIYEEEYTVGLEKGEAQHSSLELMIVDAHSLDHLCHLAQQGNLKGIIREADTLEKQDRRLQPLAQHIRELALKFEEEELLALLTQLQAQGESNQKISPIRE